MKKILSIGLLIALASMAYGQSVGAKRASLEGKDKAADVNAPKITAAEIVRAVQKSEEWLGRVDSLILRVESRQTLTPEQIEGTLAEAKIQNIPLRRYDPNSLKLDPNQGFKKSFPSISIYELAFDQNRYRFVYNPWDLNQITIWDGKQLIKYSKYFFPSVEPERYILDFSREHIESPNIFELIHWPKAQLLSFWWDPAANGHFLDNNDKLETDVEKLKKRFPLPEQFVLKGTTNYRGVDCYILEYRKQYSKSPDCRWYVGVKDKLLYGNMSLQGDKIWLEVWTTDYKEVTHGCFFPMKLGMILNLTFFDRGGTNKTYDKGWGTDTEVTDIRVNEKLPDELFEMKFKEGVKVYDERFGGTVTYRYKANRTDEEWNQIRDEGRKNGKKFKDSLLFKPAKSFSRGAEWLNSRPLTWKDLQGKIVILYFWAEWSGPCKSELPMMKELYEKIEKNKITIIGIHTPASNPEDIQKAIKQYGLDYPICIDTNAPAGGREFGSMSSAYGVNGIPYAFVINRKGSSVGHGWGVADVLDTAVRLANKPSN